MSKETSIEWSDSSLNLMMGCDGCELWNPAKGVKHCYAGTLTDRYAGHSTGYPAAFDKPKLFLERLKPALKWGDLAGKDRPDKPWLNGSPRAIFLNDMGDTFTESLPLDWLAPLLPAMADSPHLWLLLTKRARRMLQFTEKHPLPSNVWPGVSVTTQPTARRIWDLLAIKSGGVKWISVEPLLGPVDASPFMFSTDGFVATPDRGPVHRNDGGVAISWAIVGGESGPGSRPCDLSWIRSIVEQCQESGVPCFVKQLGSRPVRIDEYDDVRGPATKRLILEDKKGGTPSEWPEALRVRQFPVSPVEVKS